MTFYFGKTAFSLLWWKCQCVFHQSPIAFANSAHHFRPFLLPPLLCLCQYHVASSRELFLIAVVALQVTRDSLWPGSWGPYLSEPDCTFGVARPIISPPSLSCTYATLCYSLSLRSKSSLHGEGGSMGRGWGSDGGRCEKDDNMQRELALRSWGRGSKGGLREQGTRKLPLIE